MSKKMKLNLKELKLNSFVTSLKNFQQEKVKGGEYTDYPCTEPPCKSDTYCTQPCCF